VNIASLFVAADYRRLQHLERDSKWLQQQLGQYGPISGDFVTKSAFEEYKTRTTVGKSIMVRHGLCSGTLHGSVSNGNRWCRKSPPPSPAKRTLR
jgi:hypothetical protein